MKHTCQQPWDDIYNFNHYKVSEVKKIITRWKLVRRNNELTGFFYKPERTSN